MKKSIAGGKYKLGPIIASGSFGKVYKDDPFAIKEIRVPHRTSQNRPLTSIIANQIRILTKLNHEHTVKLFQVVEEENYIYIVMELCDGDLRNATECGVEGEVAACRYLQQIVSGYGELAALGIVHRDLKPANILVRNGCLKIADFGMSKWQEEGRLLRSHVGTPYYMAPQILQRIDYTKKCDVWSMGVIFYELLFGCLPWNGVNQESLLSAIMTQPLRLPLRVSDGVREILEGMLAISEGRRLTFAEVGKLVLFQLEMEATVEVRSFHWSVVKEMVMLEADWQASLRFKGRYEELSSEQKRTVRGEMLLLLNEEEAYMLNYLP